MKIKNILMLCGGLLVTTALLSACSSDTTYDFPGDAYSRVYFVNSTTVAEGAIVNTPIGYVGDVAAKFSVKCTGIRTTDTKVNLKIDNSLVDAYNAANNTVYKAAPEGTVLLDKTALTIPADSMKSVDSVSISVPETAYTTLSDTAGYLVPVVISSADGDNVVPSTNLSVRYMHVAISSSSIKKNAGSADMQGTLITDYSSWTGSSDTGTASTFSQMFTSSNYSGWSFSANPSTMIIDMQEMKNLTGFRMMSIYGMYGSSYSFKNVVVAVGTDGANYTDCGSATSSEMTNESGYQYICFYGSMSCRYLKLTVTWASSYGSYYYKIVHFGAYVK
jgi:hypothetical protein